MGDIVDDEQFGSQVGGFIRSEVCKELMMTWSMRGWQIESASRVFVSSFRTLSLNSAGRETVWNEETVTRIVESARGHAEWGEFLLHSPSLIWGWWSEFHNEIYLKGEKESSSDEVVQETPPESQREVKDEEGERMGAGKTHSTVGISHGSFMFRKYFLWEYFYHWRCWTRF